MSACKFIASDIPLTEFVPSQDYPRYINIDNGTIYDGGADDNYFLTSFFGLVAAGVKRWHCSTQT